MNENEKITEEDVDIIGKIIGSDNWSVIGFNPDNQKYRAYSKLVDNEALYTLLLIMRELVTDISNRLYISEGKHLSGTC